MGISILINRPHHIDRPIEGEPFYKYIGFRLAYRSIQYKVFNDTTIRIDITDTTLHGNTYIAVFFFKATQ